MPTRLAHPTASPDSPAVAAVNGDNVTLLTFGHRTVRRPLSDGGDELIHMAMSPGQARALAANLLIKAASIDGHAGPAGPDAPTLIAMIRFIDHHGHPDAEPGTGTCPTDCQGCAITRSLPVDLLDVARRRPFATSAAL